MEQELYLSDGNHIYACSLSGEVNRRTKLEGAGALYVAKEHLLCAGAWEIYRLDRRTLLPQALYSGGPGICDLCLSEDEKTLYALCGDADSVIMIDAQSGQTLLLNRVGCAPRQMVYLNHMLIVAGGESCCIHWISAQTLRTERIWFAPGAVCAVSASCGSVYALCLTKNLNSLLITLGPNGRQQSLQLAGMPGCLLLRKNMLLAATQQHLYAVSPDGTSLLWKRAMPGYAGKMLEASGTLFSCDLLSERLYACRTESRQWIPVHAGIRDMALDREWEE